MVSEFIEKEGIRNPRVLEAMRTVPRHEFVPFAFRPNAYVDAAWSIGHKQTISPPYVVAYMTEVLDPRPNDRILEIGTGSGYQAAVLSLLASDIYSIEIVEPLAKAAADRLARLGYANVHVRDGDGYAGWAEHAPFDKIIVTCSPENVPKPLINQLKEGGRMIIPLGERYHQSLCLLEKKQGRLVRQPLISTLFVPMTGRSETERTVQPNPSAPALQNGSFEDRGVDGAPSSWHYQRQLDLIDQDPPAGRLCARFSNLEPGRTAQAVQGMAVDGRRIAMLRFSLMVRTDRVIDGPMSDERAGIEVHFYDENRRPLKSANSTHWRGSVRWRTFQTKISVPMLAREAIVRIGLNGATGALLIDDIRMTAEQR
jgi:protein-L-isoaspartate(D-aspartate) O-methyltransferase